METNDNESLCLFAAKAVLKRARPVLDEADGARKGKYPECVHKMRVATRRLSTALGLFEGCVPRKQASAWNRRLRQLRRTLGRARDLDVQIAFVKEFLRESHTFLGGLAEAGFRPGIRRLLRHLRQRREQCQKKVVRAVNRFERREVLADMKRVAKEVRAAARRSPMPRAAGVRRHAKDAILERLGELQALEPCARQPDNIEAHHAMRIAAKQLRYALEVFRPLYGKPLEKFIAAAQGAQQMLGEIHDCDVWVDFLPQFLAVEQAHLTGCGGAVKQMARMKPGILFLQQDRRRCRERRFKEFAAFWEKSRTDGLRERLVELVSTPPATNRSGRAKRSSSKAA